MMIDEISELRDKSGVEMVQFYSTPDVTSKRKSKWNERYNMLTLKTRKI